MRCLFDKVTARHIMEGILKLGGTVGNRNRVRSFSPRMQLPASSIISVNNRKK